MTTTATRLAAGATPSPGTPRTGWRRRPFSGTTTSFAYNGDGLRDSLTFGANTTTFTWDIGSGLPQVLDDGAFKHIYGLGRIAEVGPGGMTHYYLPDGLGSVMALVDASGAVVNTYDYDVFGAVRSSTGTQPNAFTFTGEQTDASTGLEYLRARYYEAGTGRFVSRDPLSASSGWTGHPFLYAEDSPVSYMDPTGLSKETAPGSCIASDRKHATSVAELWTRTTVWCPSPQPYITITTYLLKQDRLLGIFPRERQVRPTAGTICDLGTNTCENFGIWQDLAPGTYRVVSRITCGDCSGIVGFGDVAFKVNKDRSITILRDGNDPSPQVR